MMKKKEKSAWVSQERQKTLDELEILNGSSKSVVNLLLFIAFKQSYIYTPIVTSLL